MNCYIPARPMFVSILTRTAAAVVAAFDTCCFRRRLKRENASLRELVRAGMEQQVIMTDAMDALAKDEMSARAQLAQLRVHQESVKHRTGFMVSAFIPEGVLVRLRNSPRRTQQVFRDKVVAVLVEHALEGLYRVSAHGKMSAMIFEPLGPESNKRMATAIFETESGFKAISSDPKTVDVTKRLTEGGVL